jgi:DNA-binding CsgD family transcriptional regulator
MALAGILGALGCLGALGAEAEGQPLAGLAGGLVAAGLASGLRLVLRAQRQPRSTPVDAKLTPHEVDLLRLLGDGRGYTDVSAELQISQSHLRGELRRIRHKLRLR